MEKLKREFKGIWITAEIWLNKELSIQEKIMLAEIDRLSNNGECYESNKHFMNFMGLKERRVKEIISDLVNKGFITSTIIYKQDSKEIEKRILKTKLGRGKR